MQMKINKDANTKVTIYKEVPSEAMEIEHQIEEIKEFKWNRINCKSVTNFTKTKKEFRGKTNKMKIEEPISKPKKWQKRPCQWLKIYSKKKIPKSSVIRIYVPISMEIEPEKKRGFDIPYGDVDERPLWLGQILKPRKLN